MAHFAEVAVGFEHSLCTTYVKDVAFDLAEANGMVTLEKLQASATAGDSGSSPQRRSKRQASLQTRSRRLFRR